LQDFLFLLSFSIQNLSYKNIYPCYNYLVLKKVIVVSLRYHIAKELVESSDFYLDLRRIKKEIQRATKT